MSRHGNGTRRAFRHKPPAVLCCIHYAQPTLEYGLKDTPMLSFAKQVLMGKPILGVAIEVKHETRIKEEFPGGDSFLCFNVVQ